MDENRTRLEQPQQDAPKKRSLWPAVLFPYGAAVSRAAAARL